MIFVVDSLDKSIGVHEVQNTWVVGYDIGETANIKW